MSDPPGFADPAWFDPEPNQPWPMNATLEQLADTIRVRGHISHEARLAFDEVLRRIDAATGNT